MRMCVFVFVFVFVFASCRYAWEPWMPPTLLSAEKGMGAGAAAAANAIRDDGSGLSAVQRVRARKAELSIEGDYICLADITARRWTEKHPGPRFAKDDEVAIADMENRRRVLHRATVRRCNLDGTYDLQLKKIQRGEDWWVLVLVNLFFRSSLLTEYPGSPLFS